MNYTKTSLSTIESREFQENGLKMTLVHAIPGHPDIRSIRVTNSSTRVSN